MANKTIVDLVDHILKIELQVVEVIEPIAYEDFATVEKIYLAKLEVLRDEGLVYWDIDAIPDAIFLPLAKNIAWECAIGFDVEVDQTLKIKDQPGVNQLFRHISKRTAGEPVVATYY